MVHSFSFSRRIVTRFLTVIGSPKLLLKWRAWEDFHFGEPEIRLLKYLVDPRKTAIDIGAAEGVYSYYLRRLARRCVAFEPNPKSFAHLKRALVDVEVHQAAVSSSNGDATLRIPIVNNIPYTGWATIEINNQLTELPSHTLETMTVRTVRPDRMALGDVGFVKIDVEGHEPQVLAGLSEILANCRPNLLIEVGGVERGGSFAELQRQLKPLGYMVLRLDENGLLSPVPHNLAITGAINLIFLAQSGATKVP